MLAPSLARPSSAASSGARFIEPKGITIHSAVHKDWEKRQALVGAISDQVSILELNRTLPFDN
jgi:hypothetical protein